MLQKTIDNIQNGDLDAYEAIVRQYQGMLMGYAANRLTDIDAAQEVVQLTFIRAYEQLNEYQVERDFGVWLCVICKHFILTELERKRRESKNIETYSQALQLRISESMISTAPAEQPEMLSALKECLKSLQSKASLVIQLRYNERQSCQSIAKSLERSVTWVTSTLSRTRKKLRSCIVSRLEEETT